MNRIMLDLETLGNKPGSIIASIGAVRFENNEIVDRFYQRVNVLSAEKLGFTMDASTVQWWLKQEDAARAEIGAGYPFDQVLGWLTVWMLKAGEVSEVWGNGSDFDNALLEAAYKKVDQAQPWGFWANRCYRTARSLFPKHFLERVGVHHRAVDDAEYQARYLMMLESTYLKKIIPPFES